MGNLYIFASLLLILYSYTQVDLALTLSRFGVLQTIEQAFQYIGYYNRPVSSVLFVGLVVLFFRLYKKAIAAVQLPLWKIVLPMVCILVFSYPAFSYDIFNYMFDAKTVLVYHKIPYTVAPLAFSGVEPWLSFMHWTHVPSSYMPFWIILSLPAYILGFGYFLTTLWSFKALMAIAYLVSVWCIWKILLRLDAKYAVQGAAIFALNPLVIFETLVSGHNDIVMMALALGAYYVYLTKKRLASFVLLSASVAVKIMTIPLIPLFFLGWQRKLSLVFMAIGFVFFIAITKREILPWYMIWFVPWYALLPRITWLRTLGTAASFGFLLSYAPFLYQGDYNPPVPILKLWIVLFPITLSIFWIALTQFAHKTQDQV